jgi:sugar phosphate isomerase/epimerase
MTPPNDATEQRWAARNLARQATFELARAAGAQPIVRPAYRGANTTVPDVDPLAGLSASRRLELAARVQAADYIRAAREAGHTWHDIGTALGLFPGADVQQAGDTVAEAAFTYAAGHPDTSFAYDRSVIWRCASCDQAISDHGLDNGPADSERGHTVNCPRLAAAIEAWDAEWAAPDPEWEPEWDAPEAGQ